MGGYIDRVSGEIADILAIAKFCSEGESAGETANTEYTIPEITRSAIFSVSRPIVYIPLRGYFDHDPAMIARTPLFRFIERVRAWPRPWRWRFRSI